MTATTPDQPVGIPLPRTSIHDQLIAEGLIVPREARLTYVRHGRPVLRIHDAGKAEAERAAQDRRILSAVPGLDAALQRRPLFGRRPLS